MAPGLSEADVLTFAGLGTLHLGADRSELPRTLAHECGGFESLDPGPANIGLVVLDDRLVRILVLAPATDADIQIETDRGIAPGAAVGEVLAAYPGAVRMTIPDIEGEEDQIRVDAADSVMIFSVDDDVVANVRVALSGYENPRSSCL